MIKLKDILLEVLEGVTDESLKDMKLLAQKFCYEFLQHYKLNSSRGSHNCAWVTQEFIKWAKLKGINSKAIYFVWPKPNGESHIAPIVNDTILDFTYNQFNKTFNDCALLTKVNDWKKVYHKFGYGINTVNVNGKDESVIIDTFDNLKNMKKEIGRLTIRSSKRIK